MNGQSDSGKGPRQRVVAARHEDCEWCQEHPAAGVRRREAVKGEFGSLEDDLEGGRLRWVLVVKLDDSHHLRLAFGTGVLVLHAADAKIPEALLELISCVAPPPKLRPASAGTMAVNEAERIALGPFWRNILGHRNTSGRS